jgi:5-aminopentanamidase
MTDSIKVAMAQIDPQLMQMEVNLLKMEAFIETAARQGTQMVVFPECALSGYVFRSRSEAIPYAETVPGPATERIALLCRKHNLQVVFGLLEKEGDCLYNCAVLLGPQGLIGRYRKVHLPYLGVDRYLDRGNEPIRVLSTPIGKIGLLICYDINFPEAVRSLALQGTEMLILPTNWPQGRQKVPKYVVVTRAFENKIFLMACDRVGQERGARFLGSSKVLDVWGNTLVEAGPLNEEIIYAEIDPAEARQKRVVLSPGEFEYDFIHDRRPRFYPGIGE